MAYSRRAVIFVVITLLVLSVGSITAQQPSHFIRVEEKVDPGRIFFKGSGEAPEKAVVTLTLEAQRSERFPLDLVLVVDRSASTDITMVREIGRAILERLDYQDRAALVSFADQASLDMEFTSNKEAVARELDELKNIGKTALGEGIALANEELIESGREDAVLIEIILMDGNWNTGREPLPQAENAAEAGIVIFIIGIGRYLAEDELTEIALATDGQFFGSFSNEVLDEIFTQTYRDVVGSKIVVTKTLPESINYEEPVFNPPDVIREEPDGATTLEWSIDELSIGETWRASFEISAAEVDKPELREINQDPSTVVFTNFRRERITLDIPVKTIEVRAPNRPPVAGFEFSPLLPSTQDMVKFTDLSSDPDGEIVLWEWEFGDGISLTVQSPAYRYSSNGTSLAVQSPTHRYSDNGTYLVKLTVTDDLGAIGTITKEIAVANTPPTVKFTFSPAEPGAGETITFDATASVDPDGTIVKYEWDLDGDGTFEIEKESPTVEKVFNTSGDKKVQLRVTDDDDATDTATKTLTVLNSAVATRTINTFLHTDTTLPGETFQVTVEIQVNIALSGMGLDENLPEGWEIKAIDNAGATFFKPEAQWIFIEEVPAGVRKTIIYEVTVSEDETPDVFQILGKISSASPSFELRVAGESEVEVAASLPVKVVMSRWDTAAEPLKDGFDIRLSDLITFNQIQLAVAQWLCNDDGSTCPMEQKDIPKTGGEVINFEVLKELIAYWLTDTPVYESLP